MIQKDLFAAGVMSSLALARCEIAAKRLSQEVLDL